MIFSYPMGSPVVRYVTHLLLSVVGTHGGQLIGELRGRPILERTVDEQVDPLVVEGDQPAIFWLASRLFNRRSRSATSAVSSLRR